jgi:hypothetical protein
MLVFKHGLGFLIQDKFVAIKYALTIILVLSFCVANNALMLFSFDENFAYYTPPQDLVGYANYVNMLNVTAQENYNGFSANYFTSHFHGCSPYHFYELWLAALLSTIFLLQPIVAYWVVVYPFFQFLVWCGLMAILETPYFHSFSKQHKSINIKQAFFCFSLLFVGGTYFPVYKIIPYLESAKYLHNNTLLASGVIEPFIIASFLLYLHKQKYLAWLAFLAIPIASITTWAGVLGVNVGLGLGIGWQNKIRAEQYKLLKAITYCTVCFLVITFVFYLTFGTKNNATTISWTELSFVFAFQYFDFINAISFIFRQIGLVFGLYLSKTIIVYLPFLLLIYYLIRRGNKTMPLKQLFLKYKKLLLIPFGVFFFSLLAMCLLMLHHDASQVFRNISFPILNMILSLLLLQIFHQQYPKPTSIYANIAFIFLILYQIYFTISLKITQIEERNIYSKSYLVAISKIAEKDLSSKMGGFIYGKTFYIDDLYSKVVRHQLPAGYLAVMPQFYTLVNLEVFEIPRSEKLIHQVLEKGYQKNSEFYQFVSEQQKGKKFVNLAQSQVDFIGKHQLGYLIIGKDATLTPQLQQLIKEKVKMEIKDEQSKERFLLLNP